VRDNITYHITARTFSELLAQKPTHRFRIIAQIFGDLLTRKLARPFFLVISGDGVLRSEGVLALSPGTERGMVDEYLWRRFTWVEIVTTSPSGE